MAARRKAVPAGQNPAPQVRSGAKPPSRIDRTPPRRPNAKPRRLGKTGGAERGGKVYGYNITGNYYRSVSEILHYCKNAKKPSR
ncbi:hypothetical protein A6M21_13080 [Desulfotomaculum copahuensis]|uniref:Uncharacterized protein n=1 Tax=Desulfotomaculum copahuensis TaxID=1838280 RepID=A0A1B7LCR6_9FIRM|nr:hypothetical protein A6M21_13080 [Desulfotomaculum copahuensis]